MYLHDAGINNGDRQYEYWVIPMKYDKALMYFPVWEPNY